MVIINTIISTLNLASISTTTPIAATIIITNLIITNIFVYMNTLL